MAKLKVKGTPTVGLIFKKWGTGGFSCTNLPISCTWRKVVEGYKINIVSLPKHHIRISRVFATLMRPIVWNTECDPLVFTSPVGAAHCFLQHLQFYQNPADWMETRAGNSILDFETLFSARCRSPHQFLVRGSPYLFSNFGAGMTVFQKIQRCNGAGIDRAAAVRGSYPDPAI